MARPYPNPPVREALCEIYFSGSRWDPATQGQFYERIKSDFPVRQQISEFFAEFNISEQERGTRVSESKARMRYGRTDGSRLVQLAPNLLVVNQLQPYPHFGDWRPVIGAMAAIYAELAVPKTVQRVGLRYINEIAVPLAGEFKLEEYFTVYPNIPESVGGKHGPYMLRLEMPTAHEGHSLVITFAMGPRKDPEKLVFTLDLYDTFAQPFPFSTAEIERRVDESHAEIERVFGNFSTQKLKALFDKESP
ncbi:MAG: TIGR04255 family protein [Candidatus Omnitrophica bacterium]|nr:TIGR04255 family protein [Candidatus Omnitrophota bacterium]